MIKIAALNEDSEEESGAEDEVSKEALEQIAIQQYTRALELQRKSRSKDALLLLNDLLETELLYDVKKPTPTDKTTEPLYNLKYLCYKNVGAIQSEVGNLDDAIDAYCAAAELDDTDITLWYRLGLICLRAERYIRALEAFEKGINCNPRHWPCLDKIVTLLLGLDHKEHCIIAIYEAFQIDPGYLRGLVYRRHIYKEYPYIKDYIEYINPNYKWNEADDSPIDELRASILIKEAEEINTNYLLQKQAQDIKPVYPVLKLQKPINKLSWSSVGESLVHMHKYMTENCYCHICIIELVFEKESQEEKMEVCEENQKPETKCNEETKKEDASPERDKDKENGSENESDKDKAATDTEKIESDMEGVLEQSDQPLPESLPPPESQPTEQKKSNRRRGSILSNLQQWDWYHKRASKRKKTVTKDNSSNIYDTLRKMVPIHLTPEAVESKDLSPEITDITSLFESNIENYFDSEQEQKEVENFILKYTENKCDIIEMLQEYLCILSQKWNLKWPEELQTIFIGANKCFNNHINIPPAHHVGNEDSIHNFVHVNMLVEELMINEKLLSSDDIKTHDYTIIDNLDLILYRHPELLTQNNLELNLRVLWLKLHVNLVNKSDELALDALYRLQYEFEELGDDHDKYKIELPNFTIKPTINENEISLYLKFLRRNKELSRVKELYKSEQYETVLTILLDSFEHCKNDSDSQEELSLDFAVQLAMILDTFWALEKVDECFQWSLTCLNEALKHFFRYTSGCEDYKKWTRCVKKILCSMEHILTNEGLLCLDSVPPKLLSQGLENLIRIIGHQVETNALEIPFDTIDPWIIMHYVLMREEDMGRGRTIDEAETTGEEIPNPLLVLFLGHEQLGSRSWCCKNDAKLLYFILDTIVPRLRTPSLSKCLEPVLQHMEQVIFCLYGYPGKKHKIKYLTEHNVNPHSMDWLRAQQVYEIIKPLELPELKGKISALTNDSEQLYHRILAFLPPEYDVQKYVPEMERYINGKETKMPSMPHLLPYKMKDIYFLLGDYYFKKDEGRMSIKYNTYDVIINNNRFESWAQITLTKGINLERVLNSCNSINHEKVFLKPAKTIIRCYERTLSLESNCDVWIEYGIFSYGVHSFCSRLLKQASESLSMESFEILENQKEDMLDTTYRCFTTLTSELKATTDMDKIHEGSWLAHYMLGKVAEKRNRPPSVYMSYYLKSVKDLENAEAVYPAKINYNSPQHNSIEVLELHYRIHASILKFIEQHEEKTIPLTVGKVFTASIDEWNNGPYARKPKKTTGPGDNENEIKTDENISQSTTTQPQAANILKRSISDAGEDTIEAKRKKLESGAAKVRRSASYETDRNKQSNNSEAKTNEDDKATELEQIKEHDTRTENTKQIGESNVASANSDTISNEPSANSNTTPNEPSANSNTTPNEPSANTTQETNNEVLKKQENEQVNDEQSTLDNKMETNTTEEPKFETNIGVKELEPDKNCTENRTNKKPDSTESSSSSSDSSSSDSSSDSSSESSRESDTTSKSSYEDRGLTEEELMAIITDCLLALEDCVSRFPLHYKALYRLAHYHFHYKKGKDIERCRDLMLSNFTSKLGSKMGGLFSEKNTKNFFNNIWRIPLNEVDRPGGFASHMNRCVLLTLEILKEIDDHKTLLEISMNFQKIPEQDKKYLREADREELAQQAFTLCVRSLKGQLIKFGQQPDLKINQVEKKAFNSLMLDIYRAYQRAQKQQPNAKQFVNLLIDGFKLITDMPITENLNLVDLSMKYCQSLIQLAKQQATQASLEKMKKLAAKNPDPVKVSTVTTAASTSATISTPLTTTITTTTSSSSTVTQSKPDTSKSSSVPSVANMSAQELTAALQSYMIADPVVQRQAAALSLSYLSNPLASSYALMQSQLNTFQSLKNSFQAEFYRQCLTGDLGFNQPTKKPKKSKSASVPKLQTTTSKLPASTSITPLSTQSKYVSQSLSSVLPNVSKLYPSSSNSQTVISKASSMTNPVSAAKLYTSITYTNSKPYSSSAAAAKPYASSSSKQHVPSSKPYSSLSKTPHPHSITSITSKSSNTTKLSSSTAGASKSFSSMKAAPTSVITSHKSAGSLTGSLAPSMGTVLSSLPPSLTAGLISSFGSTSFTPTLSQAHGYKPSAVSQALQPSYAKTLQEKLAEKQKSVAKPYAYKTTGQSSSDVSVVNRLPSSLTVTKTSVPKSSMPPKKPEMKKPITSDEVIVLDDDD